MNTRLDSHEMMVVPAAAGETHMKTIIKSGSEALFIYPEGDCDTVTVVSLMEDVVTIRMPNGTHRFVCIEDIGIGVDDDIVGITDDGKVLSY